MWQDTTRKVISEVRRSGKFRMIGGLSWIVLVVVLSLAGVLVMMFMATRRR